jgi:hypothetical protein
MNPRLSVLSLSLALFASALPLHAQDEPTAVINRAREFLGGSRVLDTVNSLRLVGRITDSANGVTGDIEIIFQRPLQQRIVVSVGDNVVTTALNDYEGYRRIHPRADPNLFTMSLFGAGEVARARANTLENLNFFGNRGARTLRRIGGERTTVEGAAVDRVDFDYGNGVVFTRYFDRSTGRLVLSETEGGAKIREEGEMRVNGIRFPRKVIISQPDGARQEIEFSEIQVNTPFPASTFEIPPLTLGN